MNKQDVVSKIAKDTGISRRRPPLRRIDSLIDSITRSLKKGDAVSFVGFGTFKIVQSQGQNGPQSTNGRRDQDSEAAVPRFSAGKALKQAVR